MPIVNKLCECGCGRSRPMQSNGKYYEDKCRYAKMQTKRNKEAGKAEQLSKGE